jgi:uncharacterized protein (TIGR02118 family)
MISVLYPNGADTKFDMNYYLTKSKSSGPPARASMSRKGSLVGRRERLPHMLLAHLAFDLVDAFQAAFGPHAAAIMGDIPNCTNVQSVVQISEVKI